MKPIKFTGNMVAYGKGQPEYEPLPAFNTKSGTTIICWKATWFDRLSILFTGKVWQYVRTCGNPIQAVCLEVTPPLPEELQ